MRWRRSNGYLDCPKGNWNGYYKMDPRKPVQIALEESVEIVDFNEMIYSILKDNMNACGFFLWKMLTAKNRDYRNLNVYWFLRNIIKF